MDPTMEQWHRIIDAVIEKKHIIVFDLGYMGFGSGDISTDCKAVTEFAELGQEFFVAFSFSKCMGLYGERVDCLHAVSKDQQYVKVIETNLQKLSGGCWSVPPQNGSYIASAVMRFGFEFSVEMQFVGRKQKID
jgi:aspartate/tyrosine/aromatic aminotransferase